MSGNVEVHGGPGWRTRWGTIDGQPATAHLRALLYAANPILPTTGGKPPYRDPLSPAMRTVAEHLRMLLAEQWARISPELFDPTQWFTPDYGDPAQWWLVDPLHEVRTQLGDWLRNYHPALDFPVPELPEPPAPPPYNPYQYIYVAEEW